MKCIFTLSLVLFPLLISAQSIILKGKIIGEDLPQSKKIYVIENDDSLRTEKFIRHQDDFSYSYEISLKDIEDKAIQSLSFTFDSDYNTDNEYACVYTVDIDRLVNIAEFNDNEDEVFYTDLFVTENCNVEFFIQIHARDLDLEEYVGVYNVLNSSRDALLQLESDFSAWIAYRKEDEKGMNLKTGSWNFNKDTQKLLVNLDYNENKPLRLKIKEESRLEFHQSTIDSTLFESATMTIKKR